MGTSGRWGNMSQVTTPREIIFTITERIFARWLVHSYGLKSMNHGNDVTCHAVLVILFLVSRKKKTTTTNVIAKNKSTTIFHGPHSYKPWKWHLKMLKTLQWNHSPVARGSTWVLNILWHHFYGLEECRSRKIVVDLLTLETNYHHLWN